MNYYFKTYKFSRTETFADFGQICESLSREKSGVLDPRKFMPAKYFKMGHPQKLMSTKQVHIRKLFMAM